MRVIRLEAANVKRIVAVDITPNGDVVEITGRNRQGKTSVLDCLDWAFTGTTDIQAKPIREGEDSAIIKVDLGDLKLTRTFKKQEDGSFTTYLKLVNADGAQYPGPQDRLNRLIEARAFDPMGFLRAKPAEQVATLRKLTGVDFAPIDQERQKAFDERTAKNRTAKDMRAAAATVQVPDDAPDEEVSVSAVMTRIEEASAFNADLERRIANRKAAQDRVAAIDAEVTALMQEKGQLEQRLAAAGPLPEPKDIAALRAETDAAAIKNTAFQAKRRRAEFEAMALEAETAADALTTQIEGFDTSKRQMIAEAKMPVEGLGFGDGVVTFGGLPLDQASDAEQLRASIAIAAAMNPDLRVIRVRDGSLLDSENFQLLTQFAREHDYQVWCEVVESGREGAIVIEDGQVARINPPVATEAKPKSGPATKARKVKGPEQTELLP